MTNPIAVVDISRMDQTAADELIDAASTLGFIFIEGSGFTQQEVDEAFALSKGFFDLSSEEKNQVPMDKKDHGYGAVFAQNLDPESSKTGDAKETFNFGYFQDGRPTHDLPDYFNQNIEKLAKLRSKCQDLCERLCVLLAMGLKIEESAGGKKWLADRHDAAEYSRSTLRFLHYPGQHKADPQAVVRAGAHTDFGSLTLLFQKHGEDGLEIHHPLTKEWTPVPFLPAKDSESAPPIIVNIADMLSFWTAGVLRSSLHRVKFPKKAQETGQDRYSIVYFLNPIDKTLLEPMPSPLVAERANRGANRDKEPVKTAAEHLDARLAKTWGWSY